MRARTRTSQWSSLVATLFVAIAIGRAQQNPTASDGPFAGRWEVVCEPSKGSPGPFGGGIPHLIVGIGGSGTSVTAKVFDVLIAFREGLFGTGSGKISEISVKDGEILWAIEISHGRQTTLRLRGRRVGDHLEGTAVADGETEAVSWMGRVTDRHMVARPSAPSDTADQKVLRAAMAKPRLERVEALKRFLNDFPQSPQKEQATYQLALSYQNQNERVAALFEFLANFPETSLKEQAHLQVALAAADNEKKAASLREFVRQFPTSKLRAEAEYQLTLTVPAGGERQAAQESFVKAYPRSAGTNQLCQLLIDAFSRAKPVDKARLNAIIDIYVDGAGDTMTLGGYTLNQRAGRLNTVAELLATAEVMLDKALALIQQALTLAGEKEAPRTKTIYLTTLGKVFYRLKNYDQAERELTRAVQTGGTEGDGQAQLFLGKMYEARQEYGAALNAYCAASELASSEDLTSSLERVYQKTYGSLSGLQDRLDATYKARPKRFEAGHYSRTATLEPARVTLAELFTGAECGPCVVADLVFDGLAERYDRKTVAVLVYHLHVPGPDPMTNPDAIARATYYGVDGTPTAFMDGRSVHVAVGSSSLAAKLFSDFTGILEARIAVAPGATLTGFRAKVNGQRIVVKGAAVVEAGASLSFHGKGFA